MQASTKRTSNGALITLVVMIVIVSLLTLGNQDYKDAKETETNYCEMVKDGLWPNYKNLKCE